MKKSSDSTTRPEELIRYKEKILNILFDLGLKPERINAVVGGFYHLYTAYLPDMHQLKKAKSLLTEIHDRLKITNSCCRVNQGKKGLIIEIPAKNPVSLSLEDFLEKVNLNKNKKTIPFALGMSIKGKPYIADLVRLPHLLIEGIDRKEIDASVNALISSIINCEQVNLIKYVFIGSGKTDLERFHILGHNIYNGELIKKGISNEIKNGMLIIDSLKRELDYRYKLLREQHLLNLSEYNWKFSKKRNHPKIPFLVIVIDDFQLFSESQGDIFYSSLAWIAMLGRAVGIHLIAVTSAPGKGKFDARIEAYFTSRLIFRKRVTNKINGITPEWSPFKLLSYGDVLVVNPRGMKKRPDQKDEILRLQYPYLPNIELIDFFVRSGLK